MHEDIETAFQAVPERWPAYIYGSAAHLQNRTIPLHHQKLIQDIDVWIQVVSEDVVHEALLALRLKHGATFQAHETDEEYPMELRPHVWGLGFLPATDSCRKIQFMATDLSMLQMLNTADISCHAWALETAESDAVPAPCATGTNQVHFLSGAFSANREGFATLRRYVRFCQRYDVRPSQVEMIGYIEHWDTVLLDRAKQRKTSNALVSTDDGMPF